MNFSWSIFLIFLLVLVLGTVLVGFTFAPWVPTKTKDLPRILKLANLKAGERFYDLGCGNGRVAFYIAKNTAAKVIGIEFGVLLFLFSKLRQIFSGRGNIEIRYGNLFHQDLSETDVVYIFALLGKFGPKIERRLRMKLEQELPKGARVISYAFPISGWEPVVKEKPTEKDTTIYLYIRSLEA